ncbi:MAG: TIGR04222 domain-containing membrane protein [Planctomycetota bacterium]
MSSDTREFIDKVESFDIDPGAKTLRFVDRLSRENNWTVEFSQRVEREYKRFCILAMIAGHPVTPSEQVDQAWHLHLTYTRSYWNRFCTDTLGGPLHHEPTAGGVAEGEKFRDWYAETLASYERIFDSAPPRDIWPNPEDRFAHAGSWKWVNVGRNWVIPKRKVWIAASVVFAILIAINIPGCASSLALRPADSPVVGLVASVFPFDLDGFDFLIFYAALGFTALTVMSLSRLIKTNQNESATNDSDAVSLNADELAVLAGGGSRLAHVALTRLFSEGRIEGVKRGWWWSRFEAKAGSTAPEGSALDRDFYHAIQTGTSTHQLIKTAQPHYERIDQSLVDQGLRHSPGWVFGGVTWFAYVIVLGLGLIRLAQGLSKGEEVGFLIVMIVIFTVAGLLIGRRHRSSTAKGRAYFDQVKSRVESNPSSFNDLDTAAIALGVAVIGPDVLSKVEGLEPLSALMSGVGTTTSGGGWGGGCGAGGGGGGGCGGGGCGGCGGCGG